MAIASSSSSASSSTSGGRPRFRVDDLAAEAVEEGGQHYVEVIDPATGDGYRFFQSEYALACGMDGQRDIAGLARWAADELGLKASPAEIEAVAATLGELGMLEGSQVAAPAVAPAAAVVAPAAAVVAAPAPAPAPAPADDDFLGTGIVAARPAPVDGPRANADFELGEPGVRPVAAASEPLGGGGDFELGAPGVGAAAAAAASVAPVDDVELGRPGKAPPVAAKPVAPAPVAPAAAAISTELSVDVGLADVKEAVRASKVIKAVDLADLPADVAAAIAEPAPAPVAAKPAPVAAPAPAPVAAPLPAPTPAPVVAKPAEPVAPAPAAPKPTPAAAPAPAAAAKPAAAPAAAAKPAAAKEPAAAAAPKKTSGALIAVLVIVLLAAGGFVLWKFVLNKPKADATTGKPAATAPTVGSAGGSAAGSAVIAPPAKVASTQVTVTPSAPLELKAGAEGELATVAAAGPVTVGAELVSLGVPSKLAKEITEIKHDVEVRYPAEIAELEKDRDDARAKGDTKAAESAEAKAGERRGRLDEKKAELTTLQGQAAAFVITATAAGTFTTSLAVGAKVAVGDVVGTLTPAEVVTARFELAGTTKEKATFAAGSDLVATVAGAGSTITCKVSSVVGTSVAIECPAGSAAAGTRLELP